MSPTDRVHVSTKLRCAPAIVALAVCGLCLDATAARAGDPPAPIVADSASFEIDGNGDLVGLGDPTVWDFGVGDTGGGPANVYSNMTCRGLLKCPLTSLYGTLTTRATLRLVLVQSRRDQYPAPGVVDNVAPFENPMLGRTDVIHIAPYGGYEQATYSAFDSPSIGADPGELIADGAQPGAVVTIDVTAAIQLALQRGQDYVAFRVQTDVKTDGDSLNDVWLFDSAVHPDVTMRPTIFFGDQPKTIVVDIRPGGSENAVNLGSAGAILVAILSSDRFNALDVDPATIRVAGAQVRLLGKGDALACRTGDPNADGRPDLLCDVATAQFLIEPGQSLVTVTAATFSGSPVSGADWIQIVP